MERPHYRIDRFDPLLRDLLSWGLVRRVETATRSSAASRRTGVGELRWQLTEEAEQRLTELTIHTTEPELDRVLYLDRRCEDCHQRVPTRLTEGAYLCDTCRLRRAEPAPAQSVPRSAAETAAHEVDHRLL